MNPDILILGAGPAGIATALTLRRHAPQLAVAVAGGPVPTRGKIGETLPPGAQAVLRALDVWEPFLASDPLPAHGTCSAWGDARLEDNEFIFHPDRRGWHIDRCRFDAMLAHEAARRGVSVWHETTLQRAQLVEPCWTATLKDAAGGLRSVAPRFVIDATGRAAIFAGQAGARRVPDDRLVAIAVTFHVPRERPMRDTYAMVEACEFGWWYSSLQPNGALAVALLTDADLAREWELKSAGEWMAALCCAAHTFRRCSEAIPQGVPVLRAADSAILDQLFGAGWLATGDAASTFDPLSSQGVVKALREGTFAAYAAIDHLAGDGEALLKYDALLRREYREFLAAKREFYARETRWREARFWRRRRLAAAPASATPPVPLPQFA